MDTVWEGEGGTNWKSSIDICTLPLMDKIDTYWEFAISCRELNLVLCDNLAGWMGWVVGGRFKREGTCVYRWLIHVDIWQKPTEHGKAIILQLKINAGESRPFVSSYFRPHGQYPARILCPWNFPGNNTGVGCHFHLWKECLKKI